MQDHRSPYSTPISCISTVMVILFALHMSVKVNVVHTSDCPPISVCCKPSHRPARGLAYSHPVPKAIYPAPVIVFMAVGKDAVPGQC